MTQPIANARFRPIIAPTLAPVIMSAAITSVYAVIAPWIPVTVVPTSLATVAMDTFITELSSVIRNWPDASVRRTSMSPPARADEAVSAAVVTGAILSERSTRRGGPGAQVALQLLDLVVDESGRIRELLLARRCRAEPELPIRLESRGELVEAPAKRGRGCTRLLIGRARFERPCLVGERLDPAGDERALGDYVVQREEASPGEIVQVARPRLRTRASPPPEHEPEHRCGRQSQGKRDPAPGRVARRRLGSSRCRLGRSLVGPRRRGECRRRARRDDRAGGGPGRPRGRQARPCRERALAAPTGSQQEARDPQGGERRDTCDALQGGHVAARPTRHRIGQARRLQPAEAPAELASRWCRG